MTCVSIQPFYDPNLLQQHHIFHTFVGNKQKNNKIKLEKQ